MAEVRAAKFAGRCNSWCVFDWRKPQGQRRCLYCGQPEREVVVAGLRFYDIAIDDWREPTQADVDAWTATAAAYGRLREAIMREHETLQVELAKIALRDPPGVVKPQE